MTFKYKIQFSFNFILVEFDVVFENDDMKCTESLLLEETKLTKQGVEKYPLGLNKEPIYKNGSDDSTRNLLSRTINAK